MNLKHIKTPKEIFSFCFNIILVLLEVLAIVLLFTIPLVWITGEEAKVGDWTSFKYFTNDSNILLMISCLISIIYITLLWNNKIKQIPEWVYVVKLIGVVGVVITMCTVLFILTPGALIVKDKTMPIVSIYYGCNLLMHVVCPIIAAILFLLFENKKDVKLTKTLYCFIPIVIYAIFYISVAYTHIDPTTGLPYFKYDWYFFCHFGHVVTPFIGLFMLSFYFLIVWLLWLGNRKINIKSINR